MRSEAGLSRAPQAEGDTPIVRLDDVKVHYPISHGVLRTKETSVVRASDGIDLDIESGRTVALVGESGSGKSTIGRVVVGMVPPTSGRVLFEGEDLASLDPKQLRRYRRTVQIVFQNPFASLDPRMRVEDIVAEPLGLYGRKTRQSLDMKSRVAHLLALVGLPQDGGRRYPHQFSGGQRQRIAIARAIAPEPRVVVLDEPTSALDVSIQAQVLNLLQELQAKLGLAYLFISHDLVTVAHMADMVAVLYLGRVVEYGTRDQIFERSHHPYTRALLASIPGEHSGRRALAVDYEPPSAADVITGCRFKSGCQLRTTLGEPEVCDTSDPGLEAVGAGQLSACHFSRAVARPVTVREGGAGMGSEVQEEIET